jgi:glycyl-tRNA synthetase
VLAENMLEMECTCLTPEVVLKTSGHVDRFTDLMVKDVETGECFRADKMLEDAIDDLLDKSPTMPTEEREGHLRIQRQADAFSPLELDEMLLKYGCKASNGEPFSPSFPFNLMFKTSIGPEGTSVGFLRPETAQGLFVNFRRLLDLNAGKMPFAAAQIGLGFRNGKIVGSMCGKGSRFFSKTRWAYPVLPIQQKSLLEVVCSVFANSIWVKSSIS